MKNYESLVDALDDLKKRGYEADFETQSNSLYCSELEEFNVDEVYRFEEASSPEDNSVLYAISSSAGVKGSLVDGYGAYSDNLSFEMAKKLQAHYTTTD